MVKGLPACSDHVAFRQVASRRSRSLQSTERSSPFRRQTQSGLGDKQRHGVDNTRRFAVSTVSAITGRLSYTPSRSVSSTSAKRKAFAHGAVGEPDCGLRLLIQANASYRLIYLSLKVMLNQVQRQSPPLLGPTTIQTLQSDNICDNGRKTRLRHYPPQDRKVFLGSVASD